MKSPETRRSNRLIRRVLPIDLVLVVALVLVADALVSTVMVWPFLRVLVGLPVLFFLPGYVLLAVLFPTDGESQPVPTSRRRFYEAEGLSFTLRLALSFGLSVALVPVYSILLALSPVGFGEVAILGLLTVHVLLGAVVGAARRLRLPPEERLHVPVGRWLSDLVAFVSGGPGWSGTAINVLLVVAVLLAASGFAYAVFAPPEDTPYTDVMLLTRSEDGQYVAAGFPTNVTRGQSRELVVGIENHRDRLTDYTVVVELQRVRERDDALQIVERSELARFQATVEPGETWYRPHDVTPDLAGTDLRLVYYFYRGPVPAVPSTDTADEYLHLWIDVPLEPDADAADSAG